MLNKTLNFAIACALIFLVGVSGAKAEPWCSPDDVAEEVATLAQVCAHEAGLNSPADCQAIREVHVRLAAHRHTSVLRQVRLYSPRALGGRTVRPWFATMGAWCQVAPSSWPESASWARNEHLWFRHYEAVERIVLENTRPPCAGSVHDWSCRNCDGMAERAERLGLIPVRCEETRNSFFARPSMRRREDRVSRRRWWRNRPRALSDTVGATTIDG